jgi:hypothetical protein
MLKRRLGILALGLGMIVSVSYAQRKPASKPVAPARKAVPEEQVTLGSGQVSGTISKSQYLREMTKPLKAGGTIEGFNFMYGERAMYEDSASNTMLVTDYLTQFCFGDTLPAVIRQTLLDRCKPGDTAYYDGIRIRRADGSEAKGKSLKLTIVP